jgi:hypothetical protein
MSGRANGTCPGIDAGDGGTQAGIADSSEVRLCHHAWRGGDWSARGVKSVAMRAATALPCPAPVTAAPAAPNLVHGAAIYLRRLGLCRRARAGRFGLDGRCPAAGPFAPYPH